MRFLASVGYLAGCEVLVVALLEARSGRNGVEEYVFVRAQSEARRTRSKLEERDRPLHNAGRTSALPLFHIFNLPLQDP